MEYRLSRILKKPYLPYGIFILVLSGIVGFSLAAKWWERVPSPEQVFPISYVDLSKGSKTGAKLLVAGAKNEYLNIYFRINGADASSFKVQLKKKSTAADITYTFYQVRSLPFMAKSKYYKHPDALIPLEQGLEKMEPLNILATIKISASRASGILTQEIVFSDNKSNFTLPLELKVWNFALADDLPISIMGNLWGMREWFAPYGVNTAAQFDEVIKSYLRSMREYKINALGPKLYPISLAELAPDKKLEEQFPGYHKILNYALNDLHYRYFCIARIGGSKKELQNRNYLVKPAKNIFPPYVEYLRRHGWERKAINKLMDEPILPYYPSVYESYALTKELAPRVKGFCTGGPPDPRLAKVIDIWAINGRLYDAPAVNSARAQGQEIWLYFNRLHRLWSPEASQRLIGWLLYRYQFTGYYFWALNSWLVNVWSDEPLTKATGGILFYPNPRNGSPWPTTRLEAMRRGFQDYQYLLLLDQAKGRGVSPKSYEEIRRRVERLTDRLRPGIENKASMTEMENMRYGIGELLDKATITR